MARGWESKSVEAAQVGTTAAVTGRPKQSRWSPEQVELKRKMEGLLLSRSRVIQDLERAHNPRYRSMLEQALSQLERELAAISEQQ